MIPSVCAALAPHTLHHRTLQARHARDAGITPAARRKKMDDPLGERNSGVGERDRKDRLHIKVCIYLTRCCLHICIDFHVHYTQPTSLSPLSFRPHCCPQSSHNTHHPPLLSHTECRRAHRRKLCSARTQGSLV